MSPWIEKPETGNRKEYKTWLGVWLDCERLSVDEFARIVMVHPVTVKHWVQGRRMLAHYAKCVKAFFPDAPIDSRGGCVIGIRHPLPIHSRSKKMYRFIFRISGLIEGKANADALAVARGLRS